MPRRFSAISLSVINTLNSAAFIQKCSISIPPGQFQAAASGFINFKCFRRLAAFARFS